MLKRQTSGKSQKKEKEKKEMKKKTNFDYTGCDTAQ